MSGVESDDEILERIAQQIEERHADEESAHALAYMACREDAEFRMRIRNQKSPQREVRAEGSSS
jgi:hypothetical protein